MMISTRLHGVIDYAVAALFGGLSASRSLPLPVRGVLGATGAYHASYALVTDYEAGDVVFHHPYSIHASGRNEDAQGRIRLSTDLRFYKKDDEGIDRRWLKIWDPDDGL